LRVFPPKIARFAGRGNKNGNPNLTETGDRHHGSKAGGVSEFKQEAFMPILMVALLALAAFGLIGVFLGAAVLLEQRKISGKHHGKVA
jgi:hypothetical protein